MQYLQVAATAMVQTLPRRGTIYYRGEIHGETRSYVLATDVTDSALDQ
jgi:hypothetical protein